MKGNKLENLILTKVQTPYMSTKKNFGLLMDQESLMSCMDEKRGPDQKIFFGSKKHDRTYKLCARVDTK